MIDAHIEQRFPGNHPPMVAVREYLVNACKELTARGLADPTFTQELVSGSDQKFWARISEALIAQHLHDKTFGVRNTKGAGPDFLVMDGTKKVWIEVVCPEAIDVPTQWLDLKPGEAGDFPHEKILLRWMSAIKVKAEALLGNSDGTKVGYLKAGLVSSSDAYIIAVNGCQLRNGPFSALMGISQFPFAAEAVFPIGPYQVGIDTQTLELVERGYQYRPSVLNKNGASVPAHIFLDPHLSPISAIWAVDLNGGSAIGNSEPMVVIHNPNASNPLPLGFLPADDEYVALCEGDGLSYTLKPVRLTNDN